MGWENRFGKGRGFSGVERDLGKGENFPYNYYIMSKYIPKMSRMSIFTF